MKSDTFKYAKPVYYIINHYYIKDKLLPKITSVLNDDCNRENINICTKMIITDYCKTSILKTGYTEFLYRMFDITKEELTDALYKLNANDKVSADELLLMIISIDIINHNYIDLTESMEALIIFTEHAIVFTKYWLEFIGLQNNLMKYTMDYLSINYLSIDKYLTRSQKNLLDILKDSLDLSQLTDGYKIKESSDDQYVLAIRYFRDKLSLILKHAATQYYINHETIGGIKNEKNK